MTALIGLLVAFIAVSTVIVARDYRRWSAQYDAYHAHRAQSVALAASMRRHPASGPHTGQVAA